MWTKLDIAEKRLPLPELEGNNFLLEKFFLKTPPANLSFFYWPELGFMLTPKIIDWEGKFLIDSGFTFWLDRGICFLQEYLEVCGRGEVLLKRSKRYFAGFFGEGGRKGKQYCLLHKASRSDQEISTI